MEVMASSRQMSHVRGLLVVDGKAGGTTAGDCVTDELRAPAQPHGECTIAHFSPPLAPLQLPAPLTQQWCSHTTGVRGVRTPCQENTYFLVCDFSVLEAYA